MDNKEFKKYVIAEAQKYLFSKENESKANLKENSSAEEQTYVFKLKHDKGTSTIKTTASSQEAALKKVMAAENAPESAITPVNESAITPSQIKKLVEEIKKINKVIDLRNPLISESDESLVESLINEGKNDIRERELDVDGINKKKHITFQNEGEKNKWERMLNYNIPNDEERP